ncbi:ABC transporter substrate-binding protein [Bordetella genomosp. 9]|uniref:ABC transporter substrate-binding protein n=1 Tax=Bordetella genomosp. 9 TaxID=1416803 RepID=A0A261RF29_9BORD|nr:ABC transporter substrate-binding protein [Bordetella genomosp. 9]OZI23387.1 ABC transporter substrate-binding protein [Bordetella genomosp. 9]
MNEQPDGACEDVAREAHARRGFLVKMAALGLSTALPGAAFSAPPAGRRGGVLRVSVSQAISKINPFQARVISEYLAVELMYSGLTRLNTDNVAEPDLALSWSSNEKLDEWTFKLRPSLKFRDGTACTPGDVIASIKAVLDAKTGSPARQNIGPIADVVSTAGDSVTFKLSTPYADLPTALSHPNAKVVPAAVIARGMDTMARESFGTGPFTLVQFESERILVATRNEHYYDPQRPYLDRVEVKVYPDATSEGSALMSGDIDLMSQVQPTEFARLSKAPRVKALRAASGTFSNIILGCNQKPFNDIRVRQALALTVDRKAMVDFVAEGYGSVANDTPINASYPFFSKQPDKVPDIAQARKLLADAGYANGLTLTLIASDVPSVRTQMAVALREMAKPAGFDIEVQTMPHATYLEQVWRKGAFYIGYYAGQPTIDALVSQLYTSTAAWNETHWDNKQFDALIEQARGTADNAQRQKLYAEAQALMRTEVPAVIPVFFDLLRAHRDYVNNFAMYPRGVLFRLDEVWLAENAPKRT